MRDRPTPEDDRGETRDQRMDRNFVEILQELRVLQTGTQILAGFLMTLPFQARFPELSDYLRGLFLVAISLAFLTTVLLVGPVSVHRALFRQHRKHDLVRVSHVMARIGLLTLGLLGILALFIATLVLGVSRIKSRRVRFIAGSLVLATGLLPALYLLSAFTLIWPFTSFVFTAVGFVLRLVGPAPFVVVGMLLFPCSYVYWWTARLRSSVLGSRDNDQLPAYRYDQLCCISDYNVAYLLRGWDCFEAAVSS